MTQLEKILKDYVNMAEATISQGGDEDYIQTLQNTVDKINSGAISAQSLIEDHQEANGYIIDGWHIEDIYQQAEQEGIELTEEEAKEVASFIMCGYDATVGVNWDVVSYAITHVTNTAK